MRIKSYDKMFWSGGEKHRVAYTSYIFSNGYIIQKWIEGGYTDLTPVRLEKKIEIRLSQRIQKGTELLQDFKTVKEALSYLKDNIGINFKKNIIDKILTKEKA